ncbi:sporulation protein [Rhizocola hellebori]|uniref:Sporulation protein n=1 Tax=Rhizocola hellebori TaxID=1392758 RepID=A0A8J3Q593_9ACTN|nr:sporulation protein [Rhizocola hellebori]GIH04080.1 sporulation protein [Rhizocola hellebori]
MVFKKMLAALGVGGPSVDTVLATPSTQPGGKLTGHVHIKGGDHDTQIEYVSLALVTRVEMESGDQEYSKNVEFHKVRVAGAFTLPKGATHQLPFTIDLPWETPITAVYGQHLHGMTMGVHTELAVAKAVDKTDLDPLQIAPLPIHEAILDAFLRLGFRFSRADLERGHIYGLHQTLPFYQEIEFYPSPNYSGGIRQLEVTFVTNPTGVDIVLEFDKRGFLGASHDSFSRYHVRHDQAASTDWVQVVDGWVRQAVQKHSAHGMPHQGHHGKPHSRGHGMGGVAAGVAGGVIGGMILGEALDDMGDMGMDFDF